MRSSWRLLVLILSLAGAMQALALNEQPGEDPKAVLEQNRRLLEKWRADPEHYARTCKRWHDNLSACREKAELKVGSSVVEDYLRYLRASASAFADGHLGLLRASFERVRGLESQHSHRRVV